MRILDHPPPRGTRRLGHNGRVDPLAAARASGELLEEWAAEPGRAVAYRVLTAAGAFGYAVRGADRFPAASLLKVPLALAVEAEFQSGGLAADEDVAVADVRSADAGALAVLAAAHRLTAAELLGLAIALSDNDCAAWLYRRIGLAPVQRTLVDVGCESTQVAEADRPGIGPLAGSTTAIDALAMVVAATDDVRFPTVGNALLHSVHASRIPLGVTEADIRVAHKTGSLAGVAHDAAVIECLTGTMQIAFLSRDQHDTLVTGYQMGICTRELLTRWGLSARTTRGLA